MSVGKSSADVPHVVVLGAGFAGMSLARTLKRSLDSRVTVTVVDKENYSLFTPMLPEVASGAIEPRHIAPALRHALADCAFEFADVIAVDPEKRSLRIRDRVFSREKDLAFDHLVIALGAETSTHEIVGAAEHSIGLRTLKDARDVRNRILGVLEIASAESDPGERARLCTIVVVGGGFTGVEASGELFAFLREIKAKYPGLAGETLRVVLVAGSGELLQQLPGRFGARAAKMLAERGVEIVLNDDVAAVDAAGVNLKSGTRYETRTVVWSAGVRPVSILASFALPLSKHGAFVVEPDCSVTGQTAIWAIGDCAQIPKAGGGFYPQTAQSATKEGPHVARNIVAAIRGRRTTPFSYRALGMMASIGDREGIAEIGGLLITGLPAWLIWRTYYLWTLPGLPLRVRVAIDWALSFFFSPSIARMQ